MGGVANGAVAVNGCGGRGSQPAATGPNIGANVAMPCPIIWNMRATLSATAGSAASAAHWSCQSSR